MSDITSFLGGAPFVPEEYQKTTDYSDAVPAGDYLLMVTGTEMRRTKSETGHYLQIQFSIADGPHKGRILYDRLNLDNPNPQCVKLARKKLTDLCLAAAIQAFSDESQLLDACLIGCVKIKDGQNEIRTYKPPVAVQPAMQPSYSSSPQSTTPAVATGAVPPSEPVQAPGDANIPPSRRCSLPKPVEKPTTTGYGSMPWQQQQLPNRARPF